METKFSQVAIEALGWYVYLLKDPRNGQIFYVGKGTGNRVFAHVTESINNPRSTDKLNLIREIKEEGYDVIHVIHRHGMTEECALEVEAAIIDMFPDTLTNAVLGHGSLRGPRTTKQLNEIYDPEMVDFGDLKVLMIKINNSYGKMHTHDATCFSWNISHEKLMKADLVMGVAYGIVRSVLVPVDTEQSNPTKHKDMWEFHGPFDTDEKAIKQMKRKVIIAHPADTFTQKRFLGKAVPPEYSTKGSQQALRYNYA